MEKKETTLQEQDAPAKNTDRAFVQVGEDGRPQMPVEEEKNKEIKQDDKEPKKA